MKNTHFILLLLSIILSIFSSCSNLDTEASNESNSAAELVGFESISPDKSGIEFINKFDMNLMKSPLEYVNAYNGGGIAIADFNNDGLEDVYFTGNIVSNRFYLNKGDFKFEDITKKSGLECYGEWCTGVTVVDVNQDGYLDIYVSKSYHDDKEKRRNSLFINNKDLTFTDKAKEYGIDLASHTIQSAFLDADNDGDLDLYIGNTPKKRTGVKPGTHEKYFRNPLMEWSDRFFINNGNGKFIDKTKEAGFFNYGWMLGVSIADYNEDGYQDIFVAVDHSEPDLLMINNHDGTFTNQIDTKMKHISASSMGTDAFDLNNDTHIDIVSLDMLSVDNYKEKTQMGSMNPELFWNKVRSGYHYQYMRNMMQLNIGNGQFSEVGQLANIHRTDWSWAALGGDFDNNGYNDIFITNGYYRSILDKDLTKSYNKSIEKAEGNFEEQLRLSKEYHKNLKEQKSKNVLYMNKGALEFELREDIKAVSHLGFSSGAAYADLDNDGDLDLVVNNIDEPATLLRNLQSEQSKNNYLTVKFASKNNVPVTGTKVILHLKDSQMKKEFTYSRGCLLYTSPSPRDATLSRMPSSA